MIPENGLLDLVADQNVHTVSHFIRFGTDKACLNVVTLPDKFIQGEAFQLRKKLLDLVVNGNPEIPVSSQDIFVEAGLTLMNAHVAAVVRRRTREGRVHILLENGMATLVDRRKHGGEGIILVKMIRHTDIIPGKAVGEGMLALRSYSGIKGKAHVGKQELLHFFLGIRIIVAFENTAVRLGRTEDFSGQGKKTFLQFLEDLVDGGAVHALLVKTQQSIVDVFSGSV